MSDSKIKWDSQGPVGSRHYTKMKSTEILVQCGAQRSETDETLPGPAPERGQERPLDTAPPTGAAGFAFDQNKDAARNSCEEHASQWAETEFGATCNGIPADVGLTGTADLAFCGDGLCRIDIVAEQKGVSDAAVYATVLRLKHALVNRFGQATRTDVKVPKYCKDRLHTCLSQRLLRISFEWRWSYGQALTYTLEQRHDTPTLVLSYRQAPKRKDEQGL
jgi:hypothetical protein